MKAALAVGNYAFTTDGQTFNRQQVYDHCLQQAKLWRQRKVGTTRIQSEIRRRAKFPDAFSAQLPEQVLEDLGFI